MTLFEVIRHLFTPHHTNNHRAKALHIDALLTYVLVFAVFNLVVHSVSHAAPDVLGYATDIHVDQLFADTNTQRTAAGLGPLVMNSELSAAAAAKAADMFAKDYWAHNSPTGTTPWDFIIAAGYHYTVAGENLAKNFSDSQSVVNAWMASPSHRANMLKPSYKDVGYAVVNGTLNGEETTLVVQMFGAQSVPAVVETPIPTPKPVVIPESAASQVNPNPQPVTQSLIVPVEAADYQSVTKTPIFNIPTMTREIVFAFLGILGGILLVDAWIARRRHVVRIAGHNIAHILFLTAMFILLTSAGRGRLL